VVVALRDERDSGRVEARRWDREGTGRKVSGEAPGRFGNCAGRVVVRMRVWGRLEVGVGKAGEVGDSSGKEK